MKLSDLKPISVQRLGNGVTQSRVKTGKYQSLSPQKTYYVKSDPVLDKDIIEVLTSQLLRTIAQEIQLDKEVYADVLFCQTDTPQDVYIASEIQPGFIDLHLYAEFITRIKKIHDDKKIRTKRAQLLEQDKATEKLIQAQLTGDTFLPSTVLRIALEDPDVNTGNMGAVFKTPIDEYDYIPFHTLDGSQNGYISKTPNQRNQSLGADHPDYYFHDSAPVSPSTQANCVYFEKEGKYIIIPSEENLRIRHIDFGGALGDNRLFNRRKLDGRIHLSNGLRDSFRYLPSRRGPSNYALKIGLPYLKSTEAAEALLKFSTIPLLTIEDTISRVFDEAKKLYDENIFIDLAYRIGAPTDDHTCIIEAIKSHILLQLNTRQEHATVQFLKHFCRLESEKRQEYFHEVTQNNRYDPMIKTKFLALQQTPFLKGYTDIQTWDITHYPNNIRPLLTRLKNILSDELCQMYLLHRQKKDSSLQNACDTIQQVLTQTQLLMDTYQANPNIEALKNYERTMLNLSLPQKILLALSNLIDAIGHHMLNTLHFYTFTLWGTGLLLGGAMPLPVNPPLSHSLPDIPKQPPQYLFFSARQNSILALTHTLTEIAQAPAVC